MPSDDPDPPRPPRILVDTNGWFLPVRSGTDLFAEIERLIPGAVVRVPTPVLRELERLAADRVDGAAAALHLARQARELRTPGRGDAGVLAAAVRTGDWVLTADRGLADRLRAQRVSVVVPRDRTRLVAHPAAPARSGRRPPRRRAPA